MKTILSAAMTAAAFALTASAAQAAPVSVLLHPDGALVQEEARLTPGRDGRTLRLVLPPSADPQTLDLSVPGHQVAALRFEEAAAPDSPVVAELRRRLDAVSRAIQEQKDAREDLAWQKTYWRQPPVQLSDSSGLAALEELAQSRLADLRGGQFAMDARLEKLEAEAALLRQRLDLTGGGASLTREAVVELAEAASGPVAARYAYVLNDAGWRPLYRIEALPDKDEVRIALEAELWQRSGSDWNGVPLVLSTADPRQNMAPPRLTDWIIRPVPPQSQAKFRSNDMMLGSMAAPMAADMAETSSVAAGARAPVYTDGSTFESWDLGKREVPAGPAMRLALNQEDFKADFAWILRPSRSETAFLSARLDMPELRHMPPGDALFLVDGVTVGRAPFSLANDDRRLYFGRDPQVTAVIRKNGQQSGKAGIIDRRQTYAWDWAITVFNKHDRPVLARVEEPAPESRDEQITISMTSRPEPVKEEHTLVWELEVPAGKSAAIRHAVSFTAPTDMKVWEGR